MMTFAFSKSCDRVKISGIDGIRGIYNRTPNTRIKARNIVEAIQNSIGYIIIKGQLIRIPIESRFYGKMPIIP